MRSILQKFLLLTKNRWVQLVDNQEVKAALDNFFEQYLPPELLRLATVNMGKSKKLE